MLRQTPTRRPSLQRDLRLLQQSKCSVASHRRQHTCTPVKLYSWHPSTLASQKSTLASNAYSYTRANAVTHHLGACADQPSNMSCSGERHIRLYYMQRPFRLQLCVEVWLPICDFSELACMLLLRPIGPRVETDVSSRAPLADMRITTK